MFSKTGLWGEEST